MSPNRRRLVHLLLAFAFALPTFRAATEDIDIFSVDEDNSVDKPNVLIVLENTSNWSRNGQGWPDDPDTGENLTQGQSEVRAIKEVIDSLSDGSVNLGLMMYDSAQGSSNIIGGYVRHHIRPMTGDIDDASTNKGRVAVTLDKLFADITDTTEKINSNGPIGTIMFDVFNYLGGLKQSYEGALTPEDYADAPDAYSSNFDVFNSPLSTADTCRRTVIIFVGNNAQGNIAADEEPTITALEDLGGDTDDIPFAEYRVTSQSITESVGTSSCYADQAACDAAWDAGLCEEQGYSNCSCGSTGTACPLSHFAVYGQTTVGVSDDTVGPTSGLYTGQEVKECKSSGQAPSPLTLTCPTTSVVTQTDTPSAGRTTTTTTSWASCAYVDIGGYKPDTSTTNYAADTSQACSGSKKSYVPRGTKTVQTVVTQQDVARLTPPDFTTSCSADASGCDTSAFSQCAVAGTSCYCDTPTDTTDCGAGDTSKFPVTGTTTQTSAEATGLFVEPDGGPWVADEWARYLAEAGVPLPNSGVTYNGNGSPVVPDSATRVPVTTYAIDVFNKQQNTTYSSLLFNMARVSGGKYYEAKNENQIKAALEEILSEVQAVNTAFSSASLPVSATNRAQSENQVFIGLFRPDRVKRPQWFGNLKRYQIVRNNAVLALGDRDGDSAINNETGFLSECATSYWTVDSDTFWQTVITDNPDAKGICAPAITAGLSPWSDEPDGPYVEKGGAAEVLRRGNDPSAAADGSGNFTLNRNILTLNSSNALVDFNTTNVVSLGDSDATDDTETINFVRGEDRSGDDPDEDNDSNLSEPRSTIHGDVIHSRPQPVNYDGRVIVYYGANDGTLHAVEADDDAGTELWSFVAPEHYSKLSRLRDNSPTIKYFADTVGAPKDYFFDGSIGLLQNEGNTKVQIYPSMRRGGRMVYAFDVSQPDDGVPGFLWRIGCDSNGACTDTAFNNIGQTWSLPSPVPVLRTVNGVTEPGTAVVFGGGYDECEDDHGTGVNQTKIPTDCSSPQGRAVYVVDADSGGWLATLGTDRSVVADVSFVDLESDGVVDFGYAADTGGGVYRIDFTTLPYSILKIAQTDSAEGRKFLFAPAVLQARTSSGEAVIYLAVGSGDREHPLRGQYPYQADMLNRFYVFKDYPVRTYTLADPFEELDLDAAPMLDKSTPDANGQCDEEVLPSSSAPGWYIDLNENAFSTASGTKNGEQVVTSAVIAGGNVFFSTNQPLSDEDTLQACTTSLGTARGYSLDIITGVGALGGDGCGQRSDEFVGGGLPPPPVITTVPVCDSNGKNCVNEEVCIGCIGDKDCRAESPLDACRIDIAIPSVRKSLYWYTKGGDAQ